MYAICGMSVPAPRCNGGGFAHQKEHGGGGADDGDFWLYTCVVRFEARVYGGSHLAGGWNDELEPRG